MLIFQFLSGLYEVLVGLLTSTIVGLVSDFVYGLLGLGG